MCSHSDLTSWLRSSCHSVVQKHLPREEPFFDYVWEAFWKAHGCSRVEDLGTQEFRHRGDQPIIELGALGEEETQVLDMLHLPEAWAGASIDLFRRSSQSEILTADIVDVINKRASQADTPGHVRRLRNEYVTGLLAEQFSALDWGDEMVPQILRYPHPRELLSSVSQYI